MAIEIALAQRFGLLRGKGARSSATTPVHPPAPSSMPGANP
jgi:hypothetical protein